MFFGTPKSVHVVPVHIGVKDGNKTVLQLKSDRSDGFPPQKELICTHFDETRCTLICTLYLYFSRPFSHVFICNAPFFLLAFPALCSFTLSAVFVLLCAHTMLTDDEEYYSDGGDAIAAKKKRSRGGNSSEMMVNSSTPKVQPNLTPTLTITITITITLLFSSLLFSSLLFSSLLFSSLLFSSLLFSSLLFSSLNPNPFVMIREQKSTQRRAHLQWMFWNKLVCLYLTLGASIQGKLQSVLFVGHA